MIVNDGVLESARQIASPNFDERPTGEISLIVLHNISLPPKNFSGDYVEAFFTNQLDSAEHPYFEQIHSMKVSSHLYIRRNGLLIQFVNFKQRAWHAGESFYQGRTRCNDFSIGIELEGSDTQPFDCLQYKKLSQVITTLQQAYHIPVNAIIGHEHISPDRKTDPGPFFDWNRLSRLLNVSIQPEIQIEVTS